MEKPQKFQLGNIITVASAHMVHDIYSSFLSPLLPLLIDKLKMSYSMAGLLSVVQSVPALFNPLVGLLADKVSIRYMLIVAPAVTAVTMSMLGLAPSYIILLILLFVMGISASLFHVPAPVLVKRISGGKTGRGMSIFMFGGEIARSLGPLLVLSAVSMWGLSGTYKLLPLGIGASVILFFKFRKIKISDGISGAQQLAGIKESFRSHIPLLVTIIGITFFSAIMKGALTAFLPTYITVKGESLWRGGIALSVFQVAGAAGTFFSGPISDRIGRRNILIIMALSTPFFMLLFVFLKGLITFLFLILLGFFSFALIPVMLSVVNDTKTDRPAFLNGMYMTINFLTGAFSVFIVGVLSDFMGLQKTYELTAILAFGAIPFVLRIPAGKKLPEK